MNSPKNDQVGNGGYRLDVENFGPIVKASVDLRPLTVFIGPSNTGKSYLAILIYALHQCFGGSKLSYRLRSFYSERLYYDLFALKSRRLGASARKSLKNWISKIAKGESLPPLPADIVAGIRTVLERSEGLNRRLDEEVCRCYGIDSLGKLVRHSGSRTRANIGLSVPQASGPGAVRYRFEFGRSGAQSSGRIFDVGSLLTGEKVSNEYLGSADTPLRQLLDFEEIDNGDLEYIIRSMMSRIFSFLFRPVRRNAYYLPADRTGVMHSHQVVVSTLIQNATTAGLRPSPDVPMLSGVLADFLNKLIGMSGTRERLRRKPRPHLATLLEGNILAGKVQLHLSETGYPNFAYRPNGWKDDLPLMRASSMVSELAPIVLYLRYVVRAGDVLIIEEPEAHLHPAMQAAFARELARLVRSGIRIIMTTHSEWILEQIGNLVRLSKLPEKARKGLEGADCALRSDEVGAWLFQPSNRPKGSTVEEATLDAEVGLYPTGYDVVSETLYNESARIFNRVQENNGG